MRILDMHIHIGRREHLSPRFIVYFQETFSPELLAQMDTLTPNAFDQLNLRPETLEAMLWGNGVRLLGIE